MDRDAAAPPVEVVPPVCWKVARNIAATGGGAPRDERARYIAYAARAAAGDALEAARARQTLDAALALLDPAWGGFYQYSTGGDWRHPHYEKLTTLQGDYLRIYALACGQFDEPRYCAAAQAVRGYANRFLRSESGAYRASQDADLRPGEHSAEYFALGDQARTALGVPKVAAQEYARENGAMIEGLATLAEVTGDRAALADGDPGVVLGGRQRSVPLQREVGGEHLQAGGAERVERVGIGSVGKMIRCLNVKMQPVKIIGFSEPVEDQLTGC